MGELVPYGDPDGVDEEQLLRASFHPTRGRPIPSMQCTSAIRSGERAGEQCRKRALLGTTVCPTHGANLPLVKKAAAQVVEEARSQLMFNAARAPDILLDLAENSPSDAVKLGAVNSLLDRVGIKAGTELTVTVHQGESPSDVLSERLRKLRERVIEGELVEESVDIAPEDDTVVLEEKSTPRPQEDTE